MSMVELEYGIKDRFPARINDAIDRVGDIEHLLSKRAFRAGRRLNRNGDPKIHQRGTTRSITVPSYSLADGWTVGDVPSSYTVSELLYDTTTNNQYGSGWPADNAEFSNLYILSLPQKTTLAAGDILDLDVRIEGRDLRQFRCGSAQARPLAVSWVMGSSYATTMVLNLYRAGNSGSREISRLVNVSVGRRRYSVVFPPDTGGDPTPNTATNAMFVNLILATGTNYTSGALNTSWNAIDATKRCAGITNALAPAAGNYIDFTGLQVEFDEVTPFEHLRYEEELQWCRRYFRRIQNPPIKGVRNSTLANATVARMSMALDPPMRGAPTVTFNGAIPAYDGATPGTITGVSTNYSTFEKFEIDATSTMAAGSVVGASVVAYESGTNSVDLDSEM